MDEQKTGTLYIVATPIGNSRDMSPRGVQILTDVAVSYTHLTLPTIDKV